MHALAPAPYAITAKAANTSAMAAAYCSGKTLKQVAEMFGVSVAGLSYKLEKAGVARRPKGNRHPNADARAADMVARYQAGETLKEIGVSYDVTRERARQIIRKAGLLPDGVWRISGVQLPVRLAKVAKKMEAEKRRAMRDQRTNDIIDAYQRGYKLREIGAMFDILHLHTIPKLMRKHGVPLRRNTVPTKFTAAQKEAAVARVLRGETQSAVARDIGAIPNTVYAWVKASRALASQVPASRPPSGD